LILFGRKKIALFCFAFIVSIAFIGWSGSRGALAGLLVGTALATLFLGRAISIFRAGIAFCSLVSGLMLSLFLPTPAPEFGILRIVSSIKGDDLGNGRSAVWESAFTEFLITPWIGHGTGSFNQNMRELYGFDYNHPHQFILQYFYDWGAIGGAAGGLLLFILFLSCLRYGRQHKDVAAYASIASLCTIAVVGMIDGALFYPLSIFLAIVAVACGFVSPPKNLTTR
jgi:O-antigen ligase